MRPVLRLLLAAVVFATSGCVSEPPPVIMPGGRSTDVFVLKHMLQDTIDLQKVTDQQYQSTLAQAAQIVLSPEAFAASYPGLIPEFQKCELQAAMARQLLQRVNAGSSTAPAAAQPKLAQALAGLQASQNSLDTLLEYCRTQMLYLKKNPQAAGTAEVRTWARNLQAETKRMHAQVKRSSAQATSAAQVL